MSPTRTAVLDRAFRPVLSRRSGVAVALSGAAGVGKSFVAHEFMQALPCRAVSLPASAALTEIVTALREVRPLPEPAAEALDRLASHGSTWDRAATAGLAEALTTLAPFVIHLDDPNAAGPTRSSEVCRLAETIVHRPGVGLLVTTRGELGRPFDDVRLEPLSPSEATVMLEEQVSERLPDVALGWVFERAAGNPLFTLEYVRHLKRQGHLWSDGQRWHWRPPTEVAVPATIAALVADAVDGALAGVASSAGDADRRILEARAVLPTGVGEGQWLKAAAVTPAEMRQGLRRLNRGGVFYRDRFAHQLYEDHVVGGLSGSRRRELARRAVAALAGDPVRAAPFVQTAELPAAEALAILAAAATVSTDPGVRGRHLASATRFTTGKERGHLALDAALALRRIDYPEAARLAQVALDELPLSTQAAELLAELLAAQGRVGEAERAAERLPSPRRARCLIHVRALAGDHVGVLEIWEREPEGVPAKPGTSATSDARPTRVPPGSPTDKPVNSPGTIDRSISSDAQLTADVATALMERGSHARAAELVLGALDQATEEERLALRGVLARVRHLQGRFTEAVEMLTSTIDEQRASGPTPALATNLQTRSELRQSLGDMRGKRADVEEAVAIYGSLGDRQSLASTQTKLGVLLIEEGEHAQAEEVLQQSRETLEALGSTARLVDCERMLCYLYRQGSLPFGSALARHYGNSALQRARELGNSQLLANAIYEASYAESLAGAPDRGLALADEGCALCTSQDLSQVGIYALFARAFAHERLGEVAEAREDYGAAAQEAGRLGLEMDAQTIGLELDRLAGDEETARRRQAWFEAQGQPRRARMVDEYFPRAPALPEASVEPVAPPRLEMLGPVRFRTPAGVRPVRGRKRLHLLALLLEARVTGRGEVSRQALWQALYPTSDTARADSSLKELVHGLRTWAGASVVTTTLAGYALGECESDVEAFLRTLDTRLWRGQFLAGAEPSDGAVREPLYLALSSRAEALLPADPREAARVGRLLVEADPYDSAALRTYLRALRKLSNHRTLTRHYQLARTALGEVGENLPERWQDFLAA